PTRRLSPPARPSDPLATFKRDITTRRNLNSARRNRSYPRVVKKALRSRYRTKKPTDHGTRHDGPPTIKIYNIPATTP
ncbi:hypothetical protein ACWD7F_39360, partial [Streptomyces sp. NPDC005122]